MMRMRLVIMVWLVSAIGAHAQVVNPTKIAWDHSAEDRAVTTRYEVGYFMGAAPAPVQTASVPIGQTTAAGTSWEAALPRPVLGSFTAKMKACGAAAGGGEVCSDWSGATDPFSLSPRAIAGLRLIP